MGDCPGRLYRGFRLLHGIENKSYSQHMPTPESEAQAARRQLQRVLDRQLEARNGLTGIEESIQAFQTTGNRGYPGYALARAGRGVPGPIEPGVAGLRRKAGLAEPPR